MVLISGMPSVGDAVSVVLTNPAASETAGQVAVALAGSTAAALAADLATAINTDPVLSGWVVASATNAIVMLFSHPGTPPLRLASYTGNGGVQIREIGRRELQFQVAIWTQTPETRDMISDPIDQAVAAAEIDFGYQLPDGTNVRLCYANSYDIEDATLQDVYRRDFLLSAEYPITTRDALYAVLVPAFQTITAPNAPPAAVSTLSLTEVPTILIVSSQTSNHTINASESGTYFDTTGAAGEVDFALPPWQSGLFFGFAVAEPYLVRVIANGGDQVAVGSVNSSAGGGVVSSTPYSFVSLYASGAPGQWVAMQIVGSWEVE
jgi:hypothetical protein